ncbi:aryl hydrocarbon receptor-like [Phycodurus eques]|uniref:aryl hydrocarbon receptor-like n=1 Tax=Phycodurus eques TaxID=693459 RepID=UPI002ACD6984|nr:aryl hydrocarbon receptor-like [Phycodurus eques]XP_061548053.1 aryl hydrocarbon receptor-like [Phycodurus eques]
MLATSGTYANKKRKKPVLKQKKVKNGNEVIKSNPSKRHRDRLNGELDRLTDLLPFSEDVRSCLDKLSVLRLSVGYLRVKSYFKATIKKSTSSGFPGANGPNGNNLATKGFSEGDLLLQALNGFVLVVTSEGSVFYTSPTIKEYLGFQQSDVVHQSVFELIHTDDRATFRQNLHFALNPPDTCGEGLEGCMSTEFYNPDQLPPENSSFLERSFVCRFRCLLDNSSGFLALKFQGRLKYLHGQSVVRDNGSHGKSQLALFAIATPVQSPSIVEIRSKMLLFQTKHKLDFTPLGVDNRGKIILGYSETELCMKGSGYQFIHAADMMYCADNHLRMIKTGDSGLTTFRLLSKSGSWVWVKANAKLIYKGGRPDFIIAYQRALVNAEGEEYLRQRRMQLPFSFTTGEAVLYNAATTMDLTQTQFNKKFNNNDDMDTSKGTHLPRSLLDCFLRQDESAYRLTPEVPFPVDQIFVDSRALVSVPSDAWQETGVAATSSAPSVVKEEAKQSVMAVIDGLQEMAQKGDFCGALEDLGVDDSELMQWEESIKRLGQDGDQQDSVRSELDNVLIGEIFDHIDSVLFKENGEECPATCLKQDTFMQASQQFPTPSQGGIFPQTNSFYAPEKGLRHVNSGQILVGSAPAFNSAQKPSHCGSLPGPTNGNEAPIQQLQLQDIFSPEIELPELIVPDSSTAPVHFAGFGQQQQQSIQCHQNNIYSVTPPTIPCNNFNTPNDFIPEPPTCPPPWSQGQYKLPHAAVTQSGPVLETQTFPRAGPWPRGVVNGLDHTQQGGLACVQAANHSSCMYVQPLTLSQSSHQRGMCLDQSSPQGNCHIQRGGSHPVVGSSAISQENANISPMTTPSNMSTSHLQCYQE